MSKHPHHLIRSRPRVFSDTEGDSLTQREHATECDINFQIARFQGLGINPFRPLDGQAFSDLSELSSDFMEAHNVLEAAREAFDDLPARIQQRFSGSPAQFMDFMADIDHNIDEALELGLLEPSKASAKPSPSQATTPTQGSGAAAGGAAVPPDGGTQGSGA